MQQYFPFRLITWPLPFKISTFLILTADNDKFAAAEAGLVLFPKIVEHIHDASLIQDPAVLSGDEDIGNSLTLAMG